MTISRPQSRLADILKCIFGNNIYMDYKGFDWLRSDIGRKQEIDIWIPNAKVAIEYDGEQHFYPVKFGSMTDEEAQKKFERTVELDKIKTNNINRSKDVEYFIRFSYDEPMSKEYIIEKVYSIIPKSTYSVPAHKSTEVDIIYPKLCIYNNLDDLIDDMFNPKPLLPSPDFVDYDVIR